MPLIHISIKMKGNTVMILYLIVCFILFVVAPLLIQNRIFMKFKK